MRVLRIERYCWMQFAGMKATLLKLRRHAVTALFFLGTTATLVCGILPQTVIAAEKSPTGITYPEMREPYRSVFDSIVSGIKSEAPRPVKALEISKGQGPPEVNEWLLKNKIKTLVSLGNQGLEGCASLPVEVRMIAGAVLAPGADNGCELYGGIAMSPAPERLFAQLKKLHPDVSIVTVVYNDALNGWLIEHAMQAAAKFDLHLYALPVENIQEAAKTYRELIEHGLVGIKHAIWLPQDPHTVDQKTILPVLLKESWNKKFIVFSSNPAHVKRGVLFALYPDYEAMGKSLGRMAISANDGSIKKTPIQPLNDVLIAVNLRTADHLKLSLSNSLKSTFNLTFPSSH